jgi:hypothetical protein
VILIPAKYLSGVIIIKMGAMRKVILLIVFTALITGQTHLNSQSVAIKESIDSINSILKANPYVDRFNEISFYYSFDVTSEEELVVEMNFDGPFKWLYKTKISDLDLTPKKDACRESPNSLCWICKKADSTNVNSCVIAEMVYTDGGSQKENSSSICVSFSGQGLICNDLNRKFQLLFTRVMNESQ